MKFYQAEIMNNQRYPNKRLSRLFSILPFADTEAGIAIV